MATTIAAPAASTPAPASSPASSAPAPAAAPISTPVAAPVSTPAAAPASFGGNSGVKTAVDPGQFRTTDEYAKAVLAEQLATTTEEVPAETVAVTDKPADIPETQTEVTAPDAEVTVDKTDDKPAEADEEDFQLEPETIVTPEALSKMLADRPEFAAFLEGDKELKGQLYKTAREAAELAPYREIFPDLESAKSAVASAGELNSAREVFMGSTTKEGTMAALGKIAEMSYERDDQGNVVTGPDGNPVIGQDFYSFVDHTVQIDLENRKADIEARMKDEAQYYAGGKTQEEAQAAYNKDSARVSLLDDLLGQVQDSPSAESDLPAHLQRKAAELDRREKAITEKLHGETVEKRRTFEKGLQDEGISRFNGQVSKILANVEKQGAVISPYLKNILPQAIGAKVIAKISANPALAEQMKQLQKLPMSDDSRARRIAAIDRAYQTYLPDVAREELRAAGVQVKSTAEAKLAKVNGQAANTRQTDPKGSTGPANLNHEPMDANKAFDAAQVEWQKANPSKRFNRFDPAFLQRVINLQLQ